eukprot:3158941-Ditylum_brightwellii.AAC.1
MKVDWHTTTTKIPHVSPADAATNAAKYLTAALAHPPNTAPFAAIGNKQLNAIEQLAEVFQHITVVLYSAAVVLQGA